MFPVSNKPYLQDIFFEPICRLIEEIRSDLNAVYRKRALSHVAWVQECATVRVGAFRQVGHSTLAQRLARHYSDALLVVLTDRLRQCVPLDIKAVTVKELLDDPGMAQDKIVIVDVACMVKKSQMEQITHLPLAALVLIQ